MSSRQSRDFILRRSKNRVRRVRNTDPDPLQGHVRRQSELKPRTQMTRRVLAAISEARLSVLLEFQLTWK
jgi:hypothetical protein